MIKYLKKSLLVSCVWDVYISIINNNKYGNNCSGGMGTFIYILHIITIILIKML